MSDRTTSVQEFMAEGHITNIVGYHDLSQKSISKTRMKHVGFGGIFSARLRYEFEIGNSPSINTDNIIISAQEFSYSPKLNRSPHGLHAFNYV